MKTLASRVDVIDWQEVIHDLDRCGVAELGPLLNITECQQFVSLYDSDDLYRSTINMARFRFGEGEYRYFADPLPSLIGELRGALWPHLLPIAREWMVRLNRPDSWPDDFAEWTSICAEAGQSRPTPLILRYEPGGWNALHRDLYGELVFPLQVVVGLSQPDIDYAGGEFITVEQRPRAQSRASTFALPQGHALVFTTRDRPLRTQRGWTAAPIRHGISTIRTGRRYALGIIFHGAK